GAALLALGCNSRSGGLDQRDGDVPADRFVPEGGAGGGGRSGSGGVPGSGGRGTGGTMLGTGGAMPGTGGGPPPMTCPVAPTSIAPPTASTACTASTLAFDSAAVCGAGAGCPITAAAQLACAGTGFGPWVAPLGTAGGSVLVTTYSNANSDLVRHLFTVDAATGPRVRDLVDAG